MHANKTPKVSVIINVYNCLTFINETIESILNQSYSNFELIIFNNASTDGTSEFLETLHDQRITVVKNDINVPLYHARNLAIENTNGEYIAFCDADDLWMPTKLEEQIKDILDSNELISCTNFIILNERNNTKQYSIKYDHLPKKSTHDLIINNPYIHMSSLLFNKKLITEHKILFNKELTILGDMDFFIRCLRVTNIRSIDNYLTVYRYHEDNTGLKEFNEIHTEGTLLLKAYREKKIVDIKILDKFAQRIEWFLTSGKVHNKSKINLLSAYKNLSLINFSKLILLLLIPSRINSTVSKKESYLSSDFDEKIDIASMNVMVIGNYAADSFGMHISESLKVMGHRVYNFSYEPNTYEAKRSFFKKFKKLNRFLFNIAMRVQMYRNYHFKKLYRALKKTNIDLIIATHDYLYPLEVENIKKITSAKICLWYPDPICTMDRALFLGCNYDYLFLKEPFLVDKFRKLTDLNIFYLPECFNPLAYDNDKKSLIDKDTYFNKSDLVAFGNFHPWRSLLLNRLLDFSLKFYGVDPPSWLLKSNLNKFFTGYPIFNQEKKDALLSSPIVINNMHFGEVWGISARIFETAGIGAFQITESNIGLD